MSPTFRVVLHGILQVLHHPFLADHLLDLRLRLRIKRIGVQHLDLTVSLGSFSSLPVVVFGKDAGEPARIIQRCCQLRPLPVQLSSQIRVSENLQPNQLGVLLDARCTTWGTTALLRWGIGTSSGDAGRAAHFADVQGQHLAIANLQFRQRLAIVGDELPVVIEVLRARLETGLHLDELSEQVDRGFRVDIEREQVLLVALRLRERDAKGNTPVTGQRVSRSPQSDRQQTVKLV
ncbi:hypothetical protein QBC47DRAFT_195660 [Echria macrotheca]|uniref:Uncharacterized protein n=1 Tax=Echria macrotheca TaxID=438768 RepID=A0AAJ0BEF0_9PEZI|nr:hypothetical protein QBC47DRAFT_195660 [Echria macrotheca]